MRTKNLLVTLSVLFCQNVLAQTSDPINRTYSVSGYRYWFDQSAAVHTGAYSRGTVSLDARGLEEGFHALHLQVVDNTGEVSPTRTSFFKLITSDEAFKSYAIKNVRYWFDMNDTPREVAYSGGTSIIQVDNLIEGFHTLHYQVVDDKGEVSPTRTSFFRLVTSDEAFKSYAIKNVRYWFDMNYAPREVVYSGGASIIQVDNLLEGFHTLHYQVVDDKGEVSPTRTSFFRLLTSDAASKDNDVATVRYWTEQDMDNVKTSDFVGGTSILDLSQTSEGTHTLYYQVITNKGEASSVGISPFERYIYDIYISEDTEYADSTIRNTPLLTSTPDLKMHYRTDDVTVRGHLTIDEGASLSLGKFVQTGNWGSQNNSEKFTQAGAEYYHLTTLVNDGEMHADSVILKQSLYRDRWYYFSLPFNTNVGDIRVLDGTTWALRRYDSNRQANGNAPEVWATLNDNDVLEAGKGYAIQQTGAGTDTTVVLTFSAINDAQKEAIFTAKDVENPLQEYASASVQNRSWNFIGNPYPSFYDTRYLDTDGTFIVWNGDGYTAYSLVDDDYVLMPFEAFFIQKPQDIASITFSKEGRQHVPAFQDCSSQRSSLLNTENQTSRRILNFELSNGVQTDQCRIVINEQASVNYEIGRDAPKFMEQEPRIPQVYSEASGVEYAINERPLGDGVAMLSVYLPADGTYTLKLEQPTDSIVLVDKANDTSVDLYQEDYTFTAKTGAYKSRFLISLTGNVTGITPITTQDAGGLKVVGNTLMLDYVSPADVTIYTPDGKTVYNGTIVTDKLILPRGIYIVKANDEVTKVAVR
jgi:hypothetical protein